MPFEVKSGKKELILAELTWILLVIFKRSFKIDKKFNRSYFDTVLGKFYIQNNLENLIVVSPSFERRDLEYLKKQINKDLIDDKKILFIDIGAYFGDFTIKLFYKLNKNKNLHFIAIEPDKEKYKLLLKNISINRIKNIKTIKYGIGNNTRKVSSGLFIKKLDNLISNNEIKKYDHVYVKLDIDGFEREALEGSIQFIKNCKNLTLLIEDFVDSKIINYLKKYFIFSTKLSSYNSFWVKK